MNVFITGSRGFVGGALGQAATRQGHRVLGISRSSQPSHDWLGEHSQADAAQTDLAPLIRQFQPDLVLHAAGTASVGNSLSQPLDDLKASLLTWANLLDSVRRSGTRPVVIFPSSAAVYGNPAEMPVSEKAPTAPISPYGFHKAACEMIGREYAQCFDFRIAICRLFSVMGPAQHRLLVWEIYKQARHGQEIRIEGTGEESRDYLHIDDVCSAMLALGGTAAVSGAPGCTTVNLASGNETIVRDLAAQVRDLVSPGKPIHYGGHVRRGDPLRWRGDVGQLRALLPGWQPRSVAAALAAITREWEQLNG